jgi:hypothetical protein
VLIEETESWFARAKAVADKGVPRGERIFGIGLFIFSVLMLLYFVAHQTGSTGLRLLSRIFDTFGGGIFATIGLAWLLVVFPFEFAHFSDVLPESIRFLFQWISNDVARVIMALGVILLGVALIYMPMAYSFVDIRRFKGKDVIEPETAANTADGESDQEEES